LVLQNSLAHSTRANICKLFLTMKSDPFLTLISYLMTLASVGDSGSRLFQESLDALLWLDEKLKQSVIVDLPGILKPLIEKLKYPIVSAAVLTWLKSDLSVFEKNISTGIMSAHILVLEEIAHAQVKGSDSACF
jgi:hypothetical protein